MGHTWTKVCPETQTQTPRTPSRTQMLRAGHTGQCGRWTGLYTYRSYSCGRLWGESWRRERCPEGQKPDGALDLRKGYGYTKTRDPLNQPLCLPALPSSQQLLAGGLEEETARPPHKGLPSLGGLIWPRKGKRPQPCCLQPGPPPTTSADRTKQTGLSAVAMVSHPA